MAGIGSRQYIHRIAECGFRKEFSFQLRHGFFRQRGDLHPRIHQNIGCNHRRPARIGNDPHPVPRGNGLGGECRSRLAQLSLIPERQDAQFFKNQLDRDVCFGQPARMRRGCFGAFGGSAGLHGQYGFFGRHFFGHIHEGFGIGQALHVQRNHPGSLVAAEIFQDFRNGYIAGIAVGGINPCPDAHLRKSLMNQFADAAALGHNRNESRLGFGKGKIAIGFQRRVRIDDALAIGPENTNAVFFGPLQKIFLKGRSFRTDFRKSGGIDDDGLDPFFPAVLHRIGYKFSGNHHMGQIDLARERQIWTDMP